MAATATKAEEQYMEWLRDAHAAEEQAVTMFTNTASRLENYPELRSKIERYAELSRRQADLVRSCIERRGGSASLLKETAGKMLGLGQALAGLFTGDEVMKALVASTAFEEMEIASYKNIISAAEHFGDHDTKRVCEGILGEEVEMRDWFESQIPGYTREYIQRAEQGQTAKH
jgi:ferritin-like metal-binding protein YciE